MNMSYNNLIYTIKDRVNIISINRPEKLNALNMYLILFESLKK